MKRDLFNEFFGEYVESLYKQRPRKEIPEVKHVYCDHKAKVTVVVFEDGSKEICRCAKGDDYNEYAGICICLAKHIYGKSKIEKINSNLKTIYNNSKQEEK